MIGVVVRMIMEQRGWKKTGKKGSLGLRARLLRKAAAPGTYHNTGGLAFWFLRAERYEHPEHTIYPTVRSRARQFKAASPGPPAAGRGDRGFGAGEPSQRDDLR